jgi:integrase
LVDSHPFLFISGANDRRHMTVGGYEKVHAAAVRRIGLVPAKASGTTPHGHRHAFGKGLAEAGMPGKLIMKMMHHSAESSHHVYTQPSIADVQAAVAAANNAPFSPDEAGRVDRLFHMSAH